MRTDGDRLVVPKEWPWRVKLMCCVEGLLGVRAKLTVGASNVNNDEPVPTVVLTVACRDSLRPTPGDSIEVVQPSVVADVHVVVPHSVRALIAIVGVYDLPAKFRPEMYPLWLHRSSPEDALPKLLVHRKRKMN